MAIRVEETFRVAAPLDVVWRFMLDPHEVVTCMPGAVLERVVDERSFLGSIQLRLGAISTSYRGRVRLTQVDAERHTLRMEAEGRESGGGTARGLLSSRLSTLPDGETEVVTEVSVELTGRVVQVGRGMIQGVSRQLFQQFAARIRARLEATSEAGAREGPARSDEPLRVLPLMLQALWSALGRFVRRLLGRPHP